jgi:hypothetical protein
LDFMYGWWVQSIHETFKPPQLANSWNFHIHVAY